MARDEGGRVLRAVRTAETVICGAGLLVTTLLIFLQVVNRYVFHFEIMVFNDLALYTFIFFMLLAAAYTTWHEGHVAVDLFRERLTRGRPVLAAAYRLLLQLLSVVVLCLLLPAAYRFMLRAIQYPEWGTLVRWFNTSWLQMLVFWSLLLVLLHLLRLVGRDLAALRDAQRGDRPAEER